MHSQAVLKHQYLKRELLSLNQSEVLAAIELLQQRLAIMQSEEYYLHIPVTELPLPPSVIKALLEHQIPTVRELTLCDWEQVKAFHHVGDKRVQQLKNLLEKMEQMKDNLRGLAGNEFREALA